MKFFLISLFPVFAFASSEIESLVKEAQTKSKECISQIKTLENMLIELSTEDANKKGRAHNAPKDPKKVEEILQKLASPDLIDDYFSRVNLELAFMNTVKGRENDALFSIEPCGTFERLEIFKALIGGLQDYDWSADLRNKVRLAILNSLNSSEQGLASSIQILVSIASLEYFVSAGFYPNFKSIVTALNAKGRLHIEEIKKLLGKYQNNQIEGRRLESRRTLALQLEYKRILHAIIKEEQQANLL